MNELYEEIKYILRRFDDNRAVACEILDCDGMEDAIIDELENRGCTVIAN